MKFKRNNYKKKVIALIGNPNVGKSTIFNFFTGLNQKVGNWSGNTVNIIEKVFIYKNIKYNLIDSPGIYSIDFSLNEEKITKKLILSDYVDVFIFICTAYILERNLNFILQLIYLKKKIILCINFIDEALKDGIKIDLIKLEKELCIKVIKISIFKKIGIDILLEEIYKKNYLNNIKLKKFKKVCKKNKINYIKKIINNVIYYDKKKKIDYKKIDKIFLNKKFSIIILIFIVFLILLISLLIINPVSDFLNLIFLILKKKIIKILNFFKIFGFLRKILINCFYRIFNIIIVTMLPTILIFYPFYYFLENSGFFPRIAFNLDYFFKKVGSCGKHALCIGISFGCNAIGVTSTKIINSRKEKLISILTNILVPCSGKIPFLITILNIFFINNLYNKNFLNYFYLTFLLMIIFFFDILIIFLLSKILSIFFLKNIDSNFIMELPIYKKSFFNKKLILNCFREIIFFIYKTILTSIPIGILIWSLSFIYINKKMILFYLLNILEPIAKLMGLDSIILMAFIFGFQANELIIPCILIGYLSFNFNFNLNYINIVDIKKILLFNNWNYLTVFNIIIFNIFHWPCITTLLSIKRETKSYKWTFLAFLIPTIIGFFLTCIITLFVRFLKIL